LDTYIHSSLHHLSPSSHPKTPHPSNSPDALARAALDLLMVLHARLDAAVHSPQPAQQQALLALAGIPPQQDDQHQPQPLTPLAPAEAWPLAWAAVLDALAAAGRDPRLAVRCHALTLLTEALLDQQSRHVGAPALARALAEIAIPLARVVVSTPAAATRPYHPPFLLPQQGGSGGGGVAPSASPPRHHHQQQQQQQHRASPMAAGAEKEKGGGGGGHTAIRAKELALSLVCQAFLSHLRELLPLPHFHELWLQVCKMKDGGRWAGWMGYRIKIKGGGGLLCLNEMDMKWSASLLPPLPPKLSLPPHHHHPTHTLHHPTTTNQHRC
jgi:hypothetical protein